MGGHGAADPVGDPVGHHRILHRRPDVVWQQLERPGEAVVVAKLAGEFHGPVAFALHGFLAPTFWLAFAGFALATIMYWWKPELHVRAREVFALPVRILQDKYGMDALWITGFAGGVLRKTQSGYLYHYAFAMILGLIAMLAVLIRYWQ